MAAIDGTVEPDRHHLFGEVGLAGDRIRRVVVVFVTGAEALGTHQGRGRVQDMGGGREAAGFFRRGAGLLVGDIDGVGFGREGEIDDDAGSASSPSGLPRRS